jgi:putative ABC transport system ATP-binding protein
MQLKLAASIIAQPRVLVLTQLFDVISETVLRRSLDRLQENGQTTVVYFSGRQRDLGFDSFLYLGHREQRLCSNFEPLLDALDDEICEGTGPRAATAGTLPGSA